MDNKQLKEAELLLRNCFHKSNKTSLLELKYKTFVELRNDLFNALKLMGQPGINEFILPEPVFIPAEVIYNIFDIHYPEWRTPSSKREYVIKRQLLHYFLQKQSPLSLKEIAKQTGYAHHSSVMHSCETVNDMIDSSNVEYVVIYNNVTKILNGYILK